VGSPVRGQQQTPRGIFVAQKSGAHGGSGTAAKASGGLKLAKGEKQVRLSPSSFRR